VVDGGVGHGVGSRKEVRGAHTRVGGGVQGVVTLWTPCLSMVQSGCLGVGTVWKEAWVTV
jgi:hypothetical protein